MTDPFLHLISINSASGVPIYRQLIDQIKQAIRMKLLQPEQHLPSVRILSSQLGVNPMTISKAYNQLELEGCVIRQRGIGMIIAPHSDDELPSDIQHALEQFITVSVEHNLSQQEMMTLLQQALSLSKKGQ